MRVDSEAPDAAPPQEQIIFLTRGKGSEKPVAHRLLRSEIVLVRAYVTCGSVDKAAKEAGLSENMARDILKRPEVAQYCEERLLEQAAAAGVTRDAVLYAIAELLAHPEREASPAHLKAIDIAAKVLKMVQPNTAVQMNNFASPFAGLPDAAVDAEILKRLSYRGSLTEVPPNA